VKKGSERVARRKKKRETKSPDAFTGEPVEDMGEGFIENEKKS